MEPLQAPQHYVPPSMRELRAEAVQRMQAGLFGLAAIVLIVGLANIINDRATLSEAGTKPVSPTNAQATAAAISDPLADIGIVPSASPSDKPQSGQPSGAVRTN